jgi:hypothetical protein
MEVTHTTCSSPRVLRQPGLAEHPLVLQHPARRHHIPHLGWPRAGPIACFPGSIKRGKRPPPAWRRWQWRGLEVLFGPITVIVHRMMTMINQIESPTCRRYCDVLRVTEFCNHTYVGVRQQTGGLMVICWYNYPGNQIYKKYLQRLWMCPGDMTYSFHHLLMHG